MTEWGRTSSPGRPPSRRAWFFFGMLFGAAAAVGGAYAIFPGAIFPGIDISQKQDIGRFETRIVELEAELARARRESGAPKSEGDAALAGKYDALARLAEEQAGQVRELTGRLEIAEQLNGELQAALDKAPSVDVESLRGQLAERDDLLTKYDAELTAVEKRAGELEAERDRLKADALANAPKPDAPGLSSGAADARKKLDAAIAEVAGLKSALGERDKALGELDAEIARLAKFEAEAAELRKTLSGNSQKSAASPAQEKLELENRARIEKELASANREIVLLQARIDASAKAAAAAQKSLGERDAKLAELDDEVARLSKFEAEANELRRELSGTSGKTASITREELERSNRIRLEKELNTANREIVSLRAKLEAADKSAAQTQGALAASAKTAADASAALGKDLAAAKTEIASLKTDLARLATEADALKTAKAAAPEKAAEPQKTAPRKERDFIRVAEAMAGAKGLENLDTDQRDRIATGLIEGECVAKVLGDVFGRPPALAMRDLIRALESDC